MQQLGHYQLEELLGEGAFARVYRAFDKKLERYVALKVLKSIWREDPSAEQRFLREARTMARLVHPNIVTIFEVGEARGQVYLAQLLVEGQTLSAKIQQGPLSWPEMLAILSPIAAALDYAHEQGVIHRDVKPGNILLGRKGQVFLGDFGLVRAAEESPSLSSSTGGIVGTPHYMAPEQWRDQPVTPATDVYALTCVVVEMLAGQLLFEGSTPAAVMTKHLVERPPLPDLWPVAAPDKLNIVLEKGLAVDVSNRLDRASALAEQLRGLALPASVVLPESKAEAAVSPETPPQQSSSQPIDKPNRSAKANPASIPSKTRKAPASAAWWKSWRGAALVSVVLLALFSYAFWPEGSEPAVPVVATAPLTDNGLWGVVMSKNTGFAKQVWYTEANFPEDTIAENWSNDYKITSIAYGSGLWAVVMSKNSGLGQQSWQTQRNFPQDFIAAKWAQDYNITSLTYGNGLWAVVMSKNTGIEKQAWITRAEFPENFVAEKWADGFNITSVGFGNGLWAVVMSKGAHITRQSWVTRTEIPKDFIDEKWAEDFNITNLAHGNGLWAVVMSKGTEFKKQTWQTQINFPKAYVDEKWGSGYDITSVAR